MQIPRLLTAGVAIATFIVVGIVGALALQPPGALVEDAGFSITTLSPNADGEDDIAVFSYQLSRTADVTITFESEDGRIYDFRRNERRVPGDYSVNFSGVVDGFTLPQDNLRFLDGIQVPIYGVEGAIERRLLPDGNYTWTLTATDDDGETETASGTFSIVNADSQLPMIQSFSISADTFTPNQDGVQDRVRVNAYLAKEANLLVYLEDENGVRRYMNERLLGRDPGEAGNHEFDYDGDVDNGFEPPPDGLYTIYAVAQDDEGQRVVRTAELSIVDGGLPQVEITPQPSGATVCFSVVEWDNAYYTDASTIGEKVPRPEGSCSDNTILNMRQGDLLVFHLSILNYGRTPVRTDGPFPGTVYEFNQLANTLGYIETDGVYRLGIHCETAGIDHPWRWAIGPTSELNVIEDDELDDTFYYLMPGDRAEVWGAIRMTDIFEESNPMWCSASLIHEGVRIDPFQQNVGRREIRIIPETQDTLLD